MSPRDLLPPSQTVPIGWKTAREWGRRWKLSETRTRSLLFRGRANGKVKCKLFRIRCGGTIRPVPHYAAA